MTGLLYLLFFCSGISGLIYQVVWVRVFGNVFGNTVYSASLVVAVFMLGLGAGSAVVGTWADRRYVARPGSLLRSYAYVELVIALMGLAVSALLPQLGRISALVSSYSRDAAGWHVLSTSSYLARAAIAVALLVPITLLMGGTLTLLIRHLVRSDLNAGGRRIALLYGVNTFGAALGACLTDFALVPRFGLFGAQMIAVGSNAVAGVGALMLSKRWKPDATRAKTRRPAPGGGPALDGGRARDGSGRSSDRPSFSPVVLISLALAMSGFAAMGMEILWFRHLTILLGGFRAVFSLLLTVILLGIGTGSLLSGFVARRVDRSAQWLMVVQGLFVAATLLGLGLVDARTIARAVTSGAGSRVAAGAELWFNLKPILAEVALPALLMGFSFPLANAVIQRAENAVGRRAGVLYLFNTVGAVGGSLAAGFLLLPTVGIQGSGTVLAIVAALAIVPLYLTTLERRSVSFAFSALVAGVAIAIWLILPSGYVIARALARSDSNERTLAMREGLTEVVEVSEVPGSGRRLLTNGHPMSATTRLSQRYMRALAHIPLLAMDHPESVLVIGFGVGNTTHAATLHPTVRRVEVADLSRDILASAGYFGDVNHDVLHDARVAVYVNDGRQHLQMQPPGSYDLITLEPPPIGYAGVAALYSTEFYALARTRLKPGGYISQWLPAYQVPGATTLAMIRAFIDVFPQAVLLSGAEAELLLIGANDSRIDVDPALLAAALARALAVKSDLQRLDLGSPREIVGAFVGSARKLAEATRDAAPASDDRPTQEYGARSLLNFGESVPASVVDLTEVAAWCPKCFVDSHPVPLVEGLDTYLALLGRAYIALPADVSRTRDLAERHGRVIAGSAYLGAIVPESADVRNILGIALAQKGQIDEAIPEFREALRLDPDSAMTHWHLGTALASRGARDEAVSHLRRAVQLDPTNALAREDLRTLTGIVPSLDQRR